MKISERRRENAARYRMLFTDAGVTEQIGLPVERQNCRHIYNQYIIRVPGRRDALRAYLADKGVGTDIYYPVPLHLQECFSYLGNRRGVLREAEKAALETLALPIYPELRPEQLEYVVQTVTQFFR